MAPELHGRVRTLFDEALSLPEAERLSFLQAASSGEPEVLPAVLRLLEAHRGSQSFLEADTRPRKRIGRYVVTGELGRGAMGIVYEAIDPLIGRKVAVKVIRLQFADAGEARFLRDRLFREARSAGLLSHPGIVVIFDVGRKATWHSSPWNAWKGYRSTRSWHRAAGSRAPRRSKFYGRRPRRWTTRTGTE